MLNVAFIMGKDIALIAQKSGASSSNATFLVWVVVLFGGFALFGVATVKMGNFGPSVGWAILLSLVIVVSNLWGIIFKEWEKQKRALSIQIKSILITCIGIIVMTISAFLQK